MEQSWKVGALAEPTGLTVRGLQHDDHIGLLRPSICADAAARLRDRLTDMAAGLAQPPHPSPDQLSGALEEMTMLDSTVSSTVALLVYDDLEAAHQYLVTCSPSVRASWPGTPKEGRLRRGRAGDQIIWLHLAGDGYRSPKSVGAATSMRS